MKAFSQKKFVKMLDLYFIVCYTIYRLGKVEKIMTLILKIGMVLHHFIEQILLLDEIVIMLIL